MIETSNPRLALDRLCGAFPDEASYRREEKSYRPITHDEPWCRSMPAWECLACLVDSLQRTYRATNDQIRDAMKLRVRHCEKTDRPQIPGSLSGWQEWALEQVVMPVPLH